MKERVVDKNGNEGIVRKAQKELPGLVTYETI